MVNTEWVFEMDNEETFNAMALQVFHYQYNNTLVYRKFVEYLGKDISAISHYSEIPFLPIELFKSQTILDRHSTAHTYFLSSGTSAMNPSKHYMAEAKWYTKSLLKSFTHFIGNPKEYVFLGILPNYLENPHSSLIYMVDTLMQVSAQSENGYFLHNEAELEKVLFQLKKEQKAVVLFGVSFALLDFLENRTIDNEQLTIIETGGMKGRKREITKQEVFQQLKKGFPNATIASEYGMTELFSQAYAIESLAYQTPAWMKLLVREIEDPQTLIKGERSGGINIIDLANFHSCSFIASADLGKKTPEGHIEILGRLDHSDLRGCSLMLL